MSACLLLCTSCATHDPFEAYSHTAPNDKAQYFLKDLQEALYVNPPWGAPRSLPVPPCYSDELRPNEIIKCNSFSPDYLPDIMNTFEVEPSKIIKDEKKTTYVYDLSSKKCPLIIVREEDYRKKSLLDEVVDIFLLKRTAPVTTRFLFYKNASGDCADLKRLLFYLELSRGFETDHPEAKPCKRPKDAAAEECQVYRSEKNLHHDLASFDEIAFSPYSVEYCYKGKIPYECRYRTKAQVKNAVSVEEASADWAEYHRREREENLAKDPLYEFTIQDKNGRTLKCGRPSPYYPVKCNDF